MEHQSVLLKETIELLNVKENGIYVDGTLGRGGHAKELVSKLKNGHLYAFDKDIEAIEESKEILKDYLDKVTLIHGDFKNMEEILKDYGVTKVDGIMMDLGVSSPQFDDMSRGFSYRYDAKLDMRMDQTQRKTAYQIVNEYPLEDLTRIFKDYGEARYAYGVAKAIIKARALKPITTTFELVDVIKGALPNKELNKKGHPAKQYFQALRIEVNDELTSLETGLRHAASLLDINGRLAIITFHSLEDRMVKTEFKQYSSAPFVDAKLPILDSQMEQASFQLVNKKPIMAGENELERNNRAHSAKLRVIERVKE